MSRKIGTMTESPGGNIVGHLQTLEMQLGFELKDNPDQARSKDSPSHLVTVRGIEIGAAWRKQIKKGERQGQEMYSMLMDDPAFAAPLNVAAFPNGKSNQYDLIWSRPVAGGGAGVSAGAMAGASQASQEPPPVSETDYR